jgi:phage terminase small subunit
MKPGPKPQPNQQKRAKGETRPSRMAEAQSGVAVVLQFPALDFAPDPPEWMNVDGQELWLSVAPMLYTQKVLTKADLAALTHLCQLHGTIIKDFKRDVDVAASDLAQLRMYFAEFGLTPSSRTRVPHGSKESGNRFGNNGKKQAPDV